jgi:casein kinase II subunit beta
LVEIEDYFLQSAVSYYDLSTKVNHYRRAVEIVKGGSYDLSNVTQEQVDRLAIATRKLYGLLHERFVITDEGIHKLTTKVNAGVYGRCPRIACKGAAMIPMGFSLDPDVGTANVWCPKCHDVYSGRTNLDGAYFGPDLPMMYLKITRGLLKFQVYSQFLETYQDGSERVPKIKQRLVRWGEIVPDVQGG